MAQELGAVSKGGMAGWPVSDFAHTGEVIQHIDNDNVHINWTIHSKEVGSIAGGDVTSTSIVKLGDAHFHPFLDP